MCQKRSGGARAVRIIVAVAAIIVALVAFDLNVPFVSTFIFKKKQVFFLREINEDEIVRNIRAQEEWQMKQLAQPNALNHESVHCLSRPLRRHQFCCWSCWCWCWCYLDFVSHLLLKKQKKKHERELAKKNFPKKIRTRTNAIDDKRDSRLNNSRIASFITSKCD